MKLTDTPAGAPANVLAQRTPAGRAVHDSEGWTASPAGSPVVAPVDEGHGAPHAARPLGPCTLISRDAVIAVTSGVDVVVAFQPVVDLADMRLRGVEALARFPAPPTLPPNLWFARAELAGVARCLELAVVRRALRLWQADPVGDYVAVNVSARTLVDPALLTTLLDADVPYGSVVVEMTEHSRVDDVDAALAAIDRLRAAGARVALDDVGAGYTSLELVRRLRPDVVKIDAGIIAQLRTVPCERVIAGAATAVARSIGATIAVEGVETLDDLQTVRALGADEGQGWLLGRPSVHHAVWRQWARGNRPAVTGG